MSNIKESLLFSFISKYAQIVISFGSSIIIARLLSPEEVGLFSIVASIVVIAHMVRDFGVSSYIIKEPEFSDEKCSAALFVTTALAWSVALILFASAGTIAEFFNRNEVENIVRLLSINFIIIPFGSISLSLLRKSMRFKALFIVNVTSAIVNASTTIILAYLGFSYLSLVISSIAGTLTTVVLATYFRDSVRFVLPLPSSVKQILTFGSQVSFTNMTNTFSESLPEILVGKYIGANAVGLMSRAQGLTKLFHYGVTEALVPVLLPDLVNKNQLNTNGAQVRYLQTITYSCSIGWPFFLLLSFIGESLIIVLFGEPWAPAAEYIKWFSALAAIKIIYNLSGELFIALDKTRQLFKSRLISNVVSVILLVLSIQHSLFALLVTLLVIAIFELMISQYFLKKYVDLSFVKFGLSLLFPLVKTTVIFLVLYLVRYIFPEIQTLHVMNIFVFSILTVISWLSVVFMSNSPLKKEIVNLF